jgi:hypothetical protein
MPTPQTSGAFGSGNSCHGVNVPPEHTQKKWRDNKEAKFLKILPSQKEPFL